MTQDPVPSAYPVGQPPAPPSPSNRRPTWATVIGIISIVMASFALLGVLLTPLSLEIMRTQRRLSGMSTPSTLAGRGPVTLSPTAEFPSHWDEFTIAGGVVGGVLGVVLLAGGIQLLRQRPAAQPLHVIYAVGSIAWGLVWIGLMPPLGLFAGLAAMGAVLGMTYPIVVLVFTLRRSSRQWFAELRRRGA